MAEVIGRISSFQSMGTLDGPGVRFVVFTQGCPLRCACCHNPETWSVNGGKIYTAEQVAERALKYRSISAKTGGITVSGGEPLLQPEFTAEIFKLCHAYEINTCLDTSGCIQCRQRIDFAITVCLILNIPPMSNIKYVGCGLSQPMEFLKQLNKKISPHG